MRVPPGTGLPLDRAQESGAGLVVEGDDDAGGRQVQRVGHGWATVEGAGRSAVAPGPGLSHTSHCSPHWPSTQVPHSLGSEEKKQATGVLRDRGFFFLFFFKAFYLKNI